MNFSRGAMSRIALSLILALGVFFGAVAQADSTTPQLPSPPSSQYVVLGSYGSLPVVVLNLTQSAINFNVSTTSGAYGTTLPLAAGLPGVYMNQGGATAMFNNILTPNTPPNGTASSASLIPQVVLNPSTNAIAVNPAASYGWMSLFTVFPSWSQPGSYNQVVYQTLSGLTNQGAAATQYGVVSGYPDGNTKNASGSSHSTTASALNAAQAVNTYINLYLMNNGATAATYKIDINSLGGGTSGNIPQESTGVAILKAMHCILDVATNISVFAAGDPLGIADYIAGLPATVSGIISQGNSANAGVVTNAAYPARSLGVHVSASALFSDNNGEVLTPVEGDSQSLFYQVKSGTNQALPLFQQNGVIITTFRQKPNINVGVPLPNGADILFVAIVNQGVYASQQLQGYINNNAGQQAVGATLSKPIRDQADDMIKILGVLTAIAQKDPQDAKYIIDMFGIHGQYPRIKDDSTAVKAMNSQLQAIFDKYSRELPAAATYAAKLAGK
jgi:hypothetical protein